MQSLEIISVNIWQIIISLCNLLILFLILKRFLYKPVNKVLRERREEIADSYAAADAAEKHALESKEEWEKRLHNAEAEANEIMKNASAAADRKQDRIINEAKNKATLIIHQAESEAKLQKKKAEAEMKSEIVDVSSAIAEKMIGREISTDDHRKLIDSFIQEIGENDDRDE